MILRCFASKIPIASAALRFRHDRGSFILNGESLFLNGESLFLNGESLFLNRVSFFLDRVSFFLDRVSFFLDRVSFFLNRESFFFEGESFFFEGESFALEGESFVIEGESFVIEGESFVIEGESFVIEGESFVIEVGSFCGARGTKVCTYSTPQDCRRGRSWRWLKPPHLSTCNPTGYSFNLAPIVMSFQHKGLKILYPVVRLEYLPPYPAVNFLVQHRGGEREG